MNTESQTELSFQPKHDRAQYLRIAGPFCDGCFAIHDLNGRVFNGGEWHGFGAAWHYPTFSEALAAMRERALPAHSKTYSEDDLSVLDWLDSCHIEDFPRLEG